MSLVGIVIYIFSNCVRIQGKTVSYWFEKYIELNGKRWMTYVCKYDQVPVPEYMRKRAGKIGAETENYMSGKQTEVCDDNRDLANGNKTCIE